MAELEEASATSPPGSPRAEVLVRLARTVSVVVGPREAVGLLREALGEAEGDDRLEAEIHLNLADAVSETEDRERGLVHAELAVAAASRVGDAALRCSAAATFGLLHFTSGRGIPQERMDEALVLERSLPGPPPAGAVTWSFAYQLVWSGELDRARALLEAAQEALHARDDLAEDDALWLLSILEWRAGNWDRAAGHAADSLALREQFGRGGLQPVAEMPAAMIAAHQGRIEEARDRSERAIALAEADGVRIAQSGHRCVLGFVELSRGDPASALEYLLPAWEIRDSVRLLEPGHRLELADTLEALIAVGELEEAEAKLVPWEERSRALDRSWALAITARCRALLLAARGDLAGAQAGFGVALAEHARTQDPFQHARTLLALGVTQRRAKQRGAARATLEEAHAAFERLGAPLWAEKARAELGRIGGRAPSRDELTEAERRIAALVAEGRTNREVAAALFVTEHTVEAALTRVYRKLGVRSRSELAHLLGHES
jgi:DNA-binding CsgD family transcriptional regulator